MTDMAYEAPSPATETDSPSRAAWIRRVTHWLVMLLPGAAFLLFWQWAFGAANQGNLRQQADRGCRRLYELFASGEIYPHLWTTGQELVFGYVIGVTGGVVGGYALGRSPRLCSHLRTHLMAFYGVPKNRSGAFVYHLVRHRHGIEDRACPRSGILSGVLQTYSPACAAFDRELVNLTW